MARSAVYFLIVRDKQANGPAYMKIGKSNDPKSRVKDLCVGLPFGVERMGYVVVSSSREAYNIEGQIHALLSDYRLRGEWFRVPSEKADKDEMMKAVAVLFDRLVVGWRFVWIADEFLQRIHTGKRPPRGKTFRKLLVA